MRRLVNVHAVRVKKIRQENVERTTIHHADVSEDHHADVSEDHHADVSDDHHTDVSEDTAVAAAAVCGKYYAAYACSELYYRISHTHTHTQPVEKFIDKPICEYMILNVRRMASVGPSPSLS